MSTIYWSDNKQKDTIDIKSVALALEADYEPYYYIRFVLTNGAKPEWEYYSKEMRDKEIMEIRELKKAYYEEKNKQ